MLESHATAMITLPDIAQAVAPLTSKPTYRLSTASDCAEINDGALLSFDATVPEQSIEDVTNSVLFCQLAADKKAGGKTQPIDWVKAFEDTLSVLGWVRTSSTSEKMNLPAPVDWPQLVLSKMPASDVALVADSIDACRALPDLSKAMRIWNGAIHGPSVVLFLIGTTTYAGGDPALSLVLVGFKSNMLDPGFLSWTLDFSITLGSSSWTLNESVYSQVRNTIIEKLGDRIKTLVETVPLT